ncbi:type I-F CRISPR-associated protein Csy2 [Pelagibaculum spongiae]|uniref:Type I-F CRISPR-associated protein Csy2 n=1 Tax=Pelagibaculum spongiae TaxID=2080658 RepID=A0A2V1GYP4_9GAMM|nr:type I-F CRISPR-associated protein Csy2 [Pelagibaculum spongiae]PVZ69765.1 type I-F CRISPR-associated protein Csy2 [Pelagibaculum spongiae]
MSSDYLVIPRIKVHNANALSSPFTVGFPAMTAWLGAVHALQRKLNQQSITAEFSAVGVVSHAFDLQTYQGAGDFVHSIIGTANPLDKNGNRPAFIEEARCHLTVSLVIEISAMTGEQQNQLIEGVQHLLNARMKIAGGDILQFQTPFIANDFTQFRNQLMPGYAIVERRDLMVEAMEQGEDALDALIGYLQVENHCQPAEVDDQNPPDEKAKVIWSRQRKENAKGWLVPIATGFHAISPLGQAKNQRDTDAPHRFAESLVTLGEFKMPYQLEQASDLLWYYETDLTNNVYLCQQAPEADGF